MCRRGGAQASLGCSSPAHILPVLTMSINVRPARCSIGSCLGDVRMVSPDQDFAELGVPWRTRLSVLVWSGLV
jgi:hypothetical protein